MPSSFRDRFFTPRVARAMTSPLGLGLGAAGAAIGLVAGLGVPGAIVLAGAGWAGRVLAAARRERATPIDPFTLSEPWRRHVQRALSAQTRFQRAVDATPDGPLRDHLADISHRLQHGIDEVWSVATKGDGIDAGLTTLDAAGARAQLARLETDSAGADTAATREALEARLATATRMQQVSTAARDRLRLLDARLNELVARGVELSVSGTASLASDLGDDVDSLVSETESLRQALEEAEGADGGSPGQPYGQPSP